MTKISIIIPIYNVEKYLEKCLDSVCNQTLKDIEIICVDDCSTDDSLEILREYASKDERIKVINFAENKGVSVARNRGIDEAQGEYIGFVDSDDYVDLDFYEKLYNKAKETDAEVVKGEIKEVEDNQNIIDSDFYDINDKIKGNKAFFYHSFTSAIYNKNLILKNSIKFPEGINHFEDPCFSILTMIFCKKLEIINGVNYYYVRNSASETKQELSSEKLQEVNSSILHIFELLNNSNICKCHYLIVYDFLFKQLLSYSNIVNKNEDIRQLFIKTIIQLKNKKKYEKDLLKTANSEKLLQEYQKYDFLNENKTNTKLKIFVSYIKPSFLFKSEILTPIHLGRDVEKDSSKDGIMSENELKWLHENCIADNDFEGNISSINRRVGFLTGTYWAWKNYEKLGNPKYFGSFGYRKLLEPSFLNGLENYDAILPIPFECDMSIEYQYKMYHGKALYEKMFNSLKKIHPDVMIKFSEYMQQNFAYLYEIYILRKKIFFDFCEWIFPVLFELVNSKLEIVDSLEKLKIVELNKGVKGYNFEKYQKRDVAFMMERLTGFYLWLLTKKPEIRYKKCEVLSTQIQEPINQKNDILAKLRSNMKGRMSCI